MMRISWRVSLAAWGTACALGVGVRAVAAASGGLQVPVYHSLPGAFASIYLDFDGDFTPSWNGYTPGHTPAYDLDGDATSFSPLELTNIHEIWSRAAEKFSPFKLNVTTVDPGDRENKKTLHVVIGGDGRNGAADYWLGFRAGGVAWHGGFFNSFPNTVFVFPGNLSGGPGHIAEVAAHETGHGFGLFHQSLYLPDGTLVDEYHPGDAQRAPIMGRSHLAARGLWWHGPTITINNLQSDLDVLSSIALNGFGYRADDHGDTRAAATPMAQAGNDVWGFGVIERMTDADVFSFITGAGAVSFALDVAPYGAMLDASLALFDDSGALLAQAATPSLSESLAMTVAEGTYYLSVTSAGGYGDIGQYFLSGTIVAIPEPASLASLASLALLALRRRRGYSSRPT